MTPAQSRAARGLIAMTQTELAKAAGLSPSTVIDFERERRAVSAEAVAAIRLALEAAGVELIAENGVRPRKGRAMMDEHEKRFGRFGADLADRMILRTLLAAVAQLANRSDPREFVAQVEHSALAQLDVPQKIDPTLSDLEDTGLRNLVRRNIRDITGRLDWGDL